MMVATAGTSFAQGPVQKEVVLTVNVPYQLRMGDYLLSAGTYTFYQVSQNDPNLFYLFRGVMRTHSPIASIRTARVEHAMDSYHGKTAMRWQLDEEANAEWPSRYRLGYSGEKAGKSSVVVNARIRRLPRS